jgi:hypothetical protein
MRRRSYSFEASVWIYPGEQGNWHFVTVPKQLSTEIRDTYAAFTRGWGSLPVRVSINRMTWETSIFPDRKSATYLLPLKSTVRRAAHVDAGDRIPVTLMIEISRAATAKPRARTKRARQA